MEPIWTPSADAAATTELRRFAAHLEMSGHGSFADYAALHRFSVEEPGAFWASLWDFAEVVGHRGRVHVVAGEAFRHTRFFPDAQLNVAENFLRHSDDQPALIYRAEDRVSADMSWAELHALVSRIQQALLAAGVERGDRVAAWLPNRPETYALMLAAASIGAVFTSTSPDFGATGVVDRFGQTTPKVLVATDGYNYNGHGSAVWARSKRSPSSSPRSSNWWCCPTQPIRQGRPRTFPKPRSGPSGCSPMTCARWSSNACRSTTPGMSCTHREPRVSPSASCTAAAACY